MASPWSLSLLTRFFVILIICGLVVCQEKLITADQARRLVKRIPGGSTWWFNTIHRQGSVPFGDSDWVVFRNVKEFGAIGDGFANDTQPLLDAMFSGPRCVGQFSHPIPCESSTITPAIVYIPHGTYLVSAPIIMPYNTLVIGDALNLPTIKADSSFHGIALLDPDPYYAGGASWYANQNNFFRQIRNLILDITALPLGTGTCIHWQVAQATSLQNLVFNMRVGGGQANQQQGIFMENGSGGFMRDLVFNGGGTAFFLGNQQFTGTNLTFNNCFRAIYMNWDWIWFWRDITINNCEIGIEMSNPENPAAYNASFGSVTIVDSAFNNVLQAIITVFNCSGSQPPTAGTLVIENTDFTGATAAVTYPNLTVILPGGQFVEQWVQGHTYSASFQPQLFPDHNNQICFVPNAPQMCVQGAMPPIEKPTGLLAAEGKVYDRAKPSYDDWSLSQFVSAKDNGCAGDGVQDDTVCLQNLFSHATWDQIAYIDHGAYVVTDTILIPKGIRIMGEGWPKIMIKSSPVWNDTSSPVPAFRVGNKGDKGDLEMQDLVFETMGPTPGAILMEWNLEEASQGSAGMWDVHWRIGGSAGTQLEVNTCQKTPFDIISVPNPNCFAAFLILHITSTASLYMENNWGWVADHELDASPHNQTDIWNGRGLLVESRKPVWIIGGAFEHSQLYNYQVANAQNLYMGHIQSETAYMQDNPIATLAYPPNASWNDPNFETCEGVTKCIKTWGLRIYNSTFIYAYGVGMYSFFQNYDSSCLSTHSCQAHAISVELSEQIYLVDVYTIGMDDMVQMDGTSLVPQGDNINTYGQCIALFEFL